MDKQPIIIAEMKKDIDYIKKDMGEMHDTMKDFIKKADNMFAKKWTENAIWGVISFVMTAVGGALLFLVLQ